MSSENETVAETVKETIAERLSFDVPGVGEIRARPGTSIAELAGAISYWHTKAQEAYGNGTEVGKRLGFRNGFGAGAALTAVLFAVSLSIHYLRSR
jgi:hypothetical protein